MKDAALQMVSAFLKAVPIKKQGSQDPVRSHLEQPLPSKMILTTQCDDTCSLGEGGDSVVLESSP